MSRFEPAGVDGVIIYLGDSISEEVSLKVGFYYKRLKGLNEPSIISIIPSYTSIYIRYNILRYDYKRFCSFIKSKFLEFDKNQNDIGKRKRVVIPVYYDKSVGVDLERVAKINSIPIKEVIKLHSQKEYLVYAIGFLPGFAYLGTVEKKIATKRLEHPRDMIPKGSVAIADTQSAVYPKDSPGGWNILGRTFVEMFSKDFKSLVEMGDIVKFEPIEKDEFLRGGGVL